MTVRITKPEINIREKLAELDKPSGIAGEAMLRAETPQEQFNLIGGGRRNLLINALFEVSQRGNYQVDASGSAHVASSGVAFNVDRWFAYPSGGTVNTEIQIVTLPTGEKVRSMKTTSQSAVGNSFLHPAQVFEPQTWMENQTFTLSAWVRTNRPGQRLRLCDTLTCFSPGDEVPNDEQWHFMTATQKMGSGFDYSGSGGQFQPAFAAGDLAVGDYVEFALPQLELGNVATPFEYRSYGEELALCQRYYQAGNNNVTGNQYASNSCDGTIFLATEMRAVPTTVFSNTDVYHAGWTQDVTASVTRPRVNSFNIRCTHTGTVGYAVEIESDWTADAELV
jgi:hypothetical protein